MEVLRRCPLAIAQRLVHCAIAVSTAVLGQSQRQCPLHCCWWTTWTTRSKRGQTCSAQLYLLTHDLFWANLRVQLHLPPLRSLGLLISPGTLNFTPPTTIDIVWRDPGGSWACLRPGSDYEWIHLSRGCDTDIYVCGVFVKQVVFLTVNHHRSLPFRELHSTDDNRSSVERPWGILSLFTTISNYEWIHPSRGCRWRRHICMWCLCEAGHFS